MKLNIIPKETINAYNTPIIQQTAYWSKVKENIGINSSAFDFKVRNSDLYINVGGFSYTHADLIIFFEYLNDKDYIAYLPYGPEVEPSEENHGIFLEELSESLRPFLPDHCVSLRYDLNWESHWCKENDYDENGQWRDLPSKSIQEFNLNFNTCNWNLKKSNTDILPTNTIIVDLRQEEQQLLMNMRPKTRYNIKLALRKGVDVRFAGIEGLDIWYNLYRETALRNNLYINDLNYFRTVFTSKMENKFDDIHVNLLIAYVDNIPLAAMFLLLSSHRATYLYGASSSKMRNFMPTYALQWRAMQIAKANNCTEYDMFGISPRLDPSHSMYGLYRFKQGFGGKIFHQLGCWDYPFEHEKYNIFKAGELNWQGYYNLPNITNK